MKRLVVIVGPTAIGKTALSISLAKKWNTEIISADSRQFYREMSIGTAKPGEEELQVVKHHFINNLSIHETYSTGKYEQEAIGVIENLFLKNDTLILTGGSGLYINAVIKGIDDLPPTDPEIRNELESLLAEEGIERLQNMIKEMDPVYFNQVDLENPHRLIRAIGVCMQTGSPFSSFRTNRTKRRLFTPVLIGLDMTREKLYERINLRVDDMFDKGLLNEAEELYPHRGSPALNTVGYKELFQHFDETISLEQARDEIKQNTRRFAKRQLTWFRNQMECQWVSAENALELVPGIIEKAD